MKEVVKKGADDVPVAGGVVPAATRQALKKGPWTAAEDAILIEYVRKHGEGNWNAVQKNSGLQRCGKSCRLRWANHLRPNLKKGSFSPEEEMLILQLHAEFGNKWARMAAHLPGRTDNEIKNYWNTRIKRRQRAGLPLYPPEIRQKMALKNVRQEQSTPWIVTSPPAIKPSQTSFSLFDSAARLLSHNSYGSVLQDPNRGKNLSFQLINFASPIQYGLGNFDIGPSPPFLNSPPSYPVKMELPSSQFSSNSGGEHIPQGNSELLDALFQASHRVGELLSSKCSDIDPLGKLGNSDFSLGIQVKQEVMETVNQDVSTLLDMIPTPTARAPTPTTILSDWYNNCSSGGEFSNGPSSVVTTDDEIGLDMNPAELNWGSPGSWDGIQWDNMPGIC